jgi:zinc transport system substrate-binding protein
MKLGKSLFAAALFCLVLTGCRNAEKQDNSEALTREPASVPVVYASNYPLYYFANRIGGENIDLHFPAAGLADPSGWNPPADSVAAMQLADLILLNGASFEGWLMNVSLPDSLLVDTSWDFAVRLLPSGETFTHSHGEEGEHAHEGLATTTWLDLSLAGLQAQSVRDALARTRPALKDMYETNYQVLASELKTLDDAFRETAKAGAGKHFAFSQPVYQYFQKAYGLEGSSLHLDPNVPLDQDVLHEIGHLKKEQNLRYMVWEGTPLPETVKKLADRGIESIVVSPLESSPESGDFLDGMRQNLEELHEVLGLQP